MQNFKKKTEQDSVNYFLLRDGGMQNLKEQDIEPVKPSGKKSPRGSAPSTNWSKMSLYKEKVVGVTRKNDDGTSRQEIISYLNEGDVIDLVRDANNEHDSNAIEVYDANEQIGFIDKNRAGELAPQMDKGYKIEAWVDRILGGDSGRSYGVLIAIQRHKPKPAPKG